MQCRNSRGISESASASLASSRLNVAGSCHRLRSEPTRVYERLDPLQQHVETAAGVGSRRMWVT